MLTRKEKRFFNLVARAAFSNPFSDERREAQRRLLEISGESTKGMSNKEIAGRSLAILWDKIAEMDSSGRADLRFYTGEDLKLFRPALLFEIFHYYTDEFDRLIREQNDAGDKSLPVTFAGELLSRLEVRGFPRDESLRYLGYFYQLRRAYYFIKRGLVGESASMRDLRRHLWNNVFTFDMRWYEGLWDRMEDFSTLLLGETGTGKGTAAAAIGRSGFIPFDDRKGCFTVSFTQNFVAVNLSQFSETLIESELFGHRKGSFTGAIEDYEGLFGRCRPHGAIFLDEIGDVSKQVQIKLLQVLQERTFSPVGGHQKLRFASRVIAATNRPLDDLRQSGEMRGDFYYRLCSDVINLPPLRKRLKENPRELILLLEDLVKRTTGRKSPLMARTIKKTIHEALGQHYPWPGNVRELEQAVRRILLTGDYKGGAAPTPSNLLATLHRGIDEGSLEARQLISGYCALLYERIGTYETVSRITGLDRRTVKKHVDSFRRRQRHPEN